MYNNCQRICRFKQHHFSMFSLLCVLFLHCFVRKDCHFIHFLSLLQRHLLKNIGDTPETPCHLHGLPPIQSHHIPIVIVVIVVIPSSV